jgi:hypothetical protein
MDVGFSGGAQAAFSLQPKRPTVNGQPFLRAAGECALALPLGF